jgi:ribosomal protein S18 acetylase RimI-like enzyme
MEYKKMVEQEIEEAVAFVARQQANMETHVPYLDKEPESIRVSFAEFQPADTALLAREGDRLVGVLGVDADIESHKAWIHGPFVDHADWHGVADAMYKAAKERGVIPAHVVGEEVLGVPEFTRLAEFAARHGFSPVKPSSSLTFQRDKLTNLPEASVDDLSAEWHKDFAAMHDEIFPNTYYLGTQLIDLLDERHKALVVIDGGKLAGYVFGKVRQEDGYIDFLGVADWARRRGHAQRLISAVTRWLLTFPEVKEVTLTMYDDNTAAHALYKALGFVKGLSLQGYRKNW